MAHLTFQIRGKDHRYHVYGQVVGLPTNGGFYNGQASKIHTFKTKKSAHKYISEKINEKLKS